jgi:GTP cyclohydrolase FolE2
MNGRSARQRRRLSSTASIHWSWTYVTLCPCSLNLSCVPGRRRNF